jgi:hypothetical protein
MLQWLSEQRLASAAANSLGKPQQSQISSLFRAFPFLLWSFLSLESAKSRTNDMCRLSQNSVELSDAETFEQVRAPSRREVPRKGQG